MLMSLLLPGLENDTLWTAIVAVAVLGLLNALLWPLLTCLLLPFAVSTPTVAHWLETGSHRLVGWECDLSSQTSASQAGILHGSNHNILPFRWWDRARKRIASFSSPGDVTRLEGRIGGRGGRWRHRPAGLAAGQPGHRPAGRHPGGADAGL